MRTESVWSLKGVGKAPQKVVEDGEAAKGGRQGGRLSGCKFLMIKVLSERGKSLCRYGKSTLRRCLMVDKSCLMKWIEEG